MAILSMCGLWIAASAFLLGRMSRDDEICNLETLLKSTMPRRDARGRFRSQRAEAAFDPSSATFTDTVQ